MSEFPYMPLWIEPWKADTGHLTFEERGLYMDLLILLWCSPSCKIPSDPAWLDRRYKQHADAMRSLCEEFCERTPDGHFWVQKRALKEWEYVRKKSKTASASANARWHKDKCVSERNANGDASAVQSQSEQNAILTPTPTYKKGDKKFASKKEGMWRAVPGSPEFQAWKAWAVDEKMTALHRELQQRETEGRGFYFEAQWPPGHQSTDHVSRETGRSDEKTTSPPKAPAAAAAG
jgi:uncharacterized protein YdaU (DUF1376 family)